MQGQHLGIIFFQSFEENSGLNTLLQRERTRFCDGKSNNDDEIKCGNVIMQIVPSIGSVFVLPSTDKSPLCPAVLFKGGKNLYWLLLEI